VLSCPDETAYRRQSPSCIPLSFVDRLDADGPCLGVRINTNGNPFRGGLGWRDRLGWRRRLVDMENCYSGLGAATSAAGRPHPCRWCFDTSVHVRQAVILHRDSSWWSFAPILSAGRGWRTESFSRDGPWPICFDRGLHPCGDHAHACRLLRDSPWPRPSSAENTMDCGPGGRLYGRAGIALGFTQRVLSLPWGRRWWPSPSCQPWAGLSAGVPREALVISIGAYPACRCADGPTERLALSNT